MTRRQWLLLEETQPWAPQLFSLSLSFGQVVVASLLFQECSRKDLTSQTHPGGKREHSSTPPVTETCGCGENGTIQGWPSPLPAPSSSLTG